jgi:hypothetical protein
MEITSNFKEFEINENNNLHKENKKRKVQQDPEILNEKITLKRENLYKIEENQKKQKEKENNEIDIYSSTLFDDYSF